ncbi:MAG: response regulator [Candidatus Wallbacteria bacterium]|nr:response regulator [Candidatus Wallbacteria bacterium]
MREGPAEILLVEDSPADADLTREAFEAAGSGVRLYVVPTGPEALDFLRHEGQHRDSPVPDLVLLDLNLPGMDGVEVLRTIKADPALSAVPVIMLSNSGAESDILRSYSNRANSCLRKPLGIDDFLLMVESLLAFWLKVACLPARSAARSSGGVSEGIASL